MEKIKLFFKAQVARLRVYVKSQSFKSQVNRALRLFAMSMVVSIVGLYKSHALTAQAVGAAVLAALEVIYRGFFPAATNAPLTPAVTVPAPSEPEDASDVEANPED